MGYDPLTANSAEEAIKLAQRHEKKIDLLLTDVIMPMVNGRVLAKRIRSMHPEIKVVFMSGYTADVIAHHGIMEEGIHFVPKPLSRKTLR